MTQVAKTVFLVLICLGVGLAARAADEDFLLALTALAGARSYPEKEAAAAAISATGHPRVEAILSALLEGQVYVTPTDNKVVIATTVDDGFAIADAVTGAELGTVGRRDVNRVTVNNQLRASLRALLATLKLRHDDPRERAAAILEVGESEDPAMLATLAELKTTETSGRALAAIDTAIAMLNLDSADASLRLAAIETVRGDTGAHVRTKLAGLAGERVPGPRNARRRIERPRAHREQDADLRPRANRVLRSELGLDPRARRDRSLRHFRHHGRDQHGARRAHDARRLYHLRRAAGFSERDRRIVVHCDAGRVLDFRHRGDRHRARHRAVPVRPPARDAARDVRREPRAAARRAHRVLAAQSLRDDARMDERSWEITSGLAITYNRLYILVFSLLVFGALLLVLRRTRLGLEMRAVTQNRAMAKAMGIRTDRVDALTFGLGSGIAGLAGVALSQLTNVGTEPRPVLHRRLVHGRRVRRSRLALGHARQRPVARRRKQAHRAAAGAVMAKIFVLLFLIIFIQKRPRGLFPQKGRAAEG